MGDFNVAFTEANMAAFCNEYKLKPLNKEPTCVKNYMSLTSTEFKRSHPEVFLGKGILKICRKSTGEHSCHRVISIKLQSNFIEISLRHECSPENLLHRTAFTKNSSGRLLLRLGSNKLSKKL